ncbi:MAG: hypothetical protein OXR66_07465 [Candidatus Woesearchaeota archaeon]|nr:hypothetical protein [Candidatus Woesearchaeota archaeon]
MKLIKPPEELLEKALEDSRVHYLLNAASQELPEKPIQRFSSEELAAAGITDAFLSPHGASLEDPHEALRGWRRNEVEAEVYRNIVLGNLEEAMREHGYDIDATALRGITTSLNDTVTVEDRHGEMRIVNIVKTLRMGVEKPTEKNNLRLTKTPSLLSGEVNYPPKYMGNSVNYAHDEAGEPRNQQLHPALLVYDLNKIEPIENSSVRYRLPSSEARNELISGAFICDKLLL